MLRSAVVVPVPEAARAVDHWREQTCNDKPSRGVPAHITLVFPFVPAKQLHQGTISLLAEIIANVGAFEFEFGRLARFTETLYLPPEPSLPFVRLTEAIVGQFPEHPAYEGAYEAIVPHLTVARGDAAVLGQAEADVRRLLPISSTAAEAVLLEEIEPDWKKWEVRSRLPLGG